MSEQLYQQVLQDNQELEEFTKKLIEMNERKEQLAQYYHGEWINDYEANLESESDMYTEDGIWDALYNQNAALLKLNKVIASMLYAEDDQ